MATTFDRLPKGSLVLVTGATGYIGSAVVHVLLERGFRVRATTRSAAKAASWTEHFTKKFDKADVDFVAFADYTSPEGYGKVLEGVDGVVHLATDTSFGTSYEQIVEGSTAATLAILRAATKYPQIKSVVVTSSIVAAFSGRDGKDIVADQNTYNPIAETARSLDPNDPASGSDMYAASKAESERQAWAFVREASPPWAFNTVLPALVAGPDFGPEPSATTKAWLTELFKGNPDSPAAGVLAAGTPIVDIRDIAALHVAALLDTKTNGLRLWGMPQKMSGNDILATWRAAFPDKKVVDDFPKQARPSITADESESDRLIQAWQGGWTDWKKTVVDNVTAA